MALKRILNETFRKAQAENFQKFLENLPPSTNAFQKIYRFVKIKSNSFCTELKHNDEIIYDTKKIAECFNSHFTSIYSENIFNQQLSSNINSFLGTLRENMPETITCFSIENSSLEGDTEPLINIEEVSATINSLNSKKSAGPDSISNMIIKKFTPLACSFLTIIYNNCLNNSYFPQQWKIAEILPIKKRPSATSVADYRPISLLSNLGKLFEKLILTKLENIFIEHIPNYQFGFKKQHSTQHALLKFTNDVTLGLRNKNCTVAISLDIEKAFDAVYHDGIIYKLAKLNTPHYLINILQSFLSNRNFFITICNDSSELGEIGRGVPQGSILAPFLFNVFLYDFPHRFESSKSILYADDALVYAQDTSPIRAQRKAESHLNVILHFYEKWGIKVNKEKTEFICLRNSYANGVRGAVKEAKSLTLMLNGHTIKPKDKMKYLGVFFHKLFKFNNHANIVLGKAIARFRCLSPIMDYSYLSKKLKLLLYKVAIRPIITYAVPIWFSCSPTIIKKIEIFERKMLRLCVSKNFQSLNKRFSNEFIYNEAKVLPLSRYIMYLMHNFVSKLEDHPNPLISEAIQSQRHSTWASSKYLSPLNIIHEDIIINRKCIDCFTSYFYSKKLIGSHRG